jgi:hypothetical protein
VEWVKENSGQRSVLSEENEWGTTEEKSKKAR